MIITKSPLSWWDTIISWWIVGHVVKPSVPFRGNIGCVIVITLFEVLFGINNITVATDWIFIVDVIFISLTSFNQMNAIKMCQTSCIFTNEFTITNV